MIQDTTILAHFRIFYNHSHKQITKKLKELKEVARVDDVIDITPEIHNEEAHDGSKSAINLPRPTNIPPNRKPSTFRKRNLAGRKNAPKNAISGSQSSMKLKINLASALKTLTLTLSVICPEAGKCLQGILKVLKPMLSSVTICNILG